MTAGADGGPAFPNSPGYRGMTLRDYFAAKAMAGLIVRWKDLRPSSEDIAESAYSIADAMLAEREEGGAA